MDVQAAQTNAEVAGKTTVEVGKVFGAAGVDGLILYAIVLFAAFMFILSLLLVWVAFRAMARKDAELTAALAAKDKLNAEQTNSFIAAADRLGDALNAMAVATATQTAVQGGNQNILARIDGLLTRLDRVPS